ncbi:hypothetical protein V475_05150 [Sphingobium baderi LL03]|uniref:Uncharacterized protein n=1 Tax=Sphingobium baderi LL03 TaxID=1114964 RepID=T0I2X4_9SPHN|nr:hypothetical protein L485_04735 [Sphingobium baderi LL03]KMS63225.1 hypothetical protein V475_05150 [Sphingobium baderi LL03]
MPASRSRMIASTMNSVMQIQPILMWRHVLPSPRGSARMVATLVIAIGKNRRPAMKGRAGVRGFQTTKYNNVP